MNLFRRFRRRSRDPVDEWSEELRATVVERFSDDQVAQIVDAASEAAASGVGAGGAAAAGTAASGAATAGATGVSVATVAKIGAGILATALAGGAIAGITGNLPDPIQSWLSDVADGIGIDLPHPDDPVDLPDLDAPSVTVPTLPGEIVPGAPGVTVPEVPTVTVPEVTVPVLD